MKFSISPYVYDVRLCLEVKPCWKAKRHNARLRAVRTLGGSTALTSTPHELNSNPGEKLWEAGSRFGVSVRAPAVTPGPPFGPCAAKRSKHTACFSRTRHTRDGHALEGLNELGPGIRRDQSAGHHRAALSRWHGAAIRRCSRSHWDL